LKKKGSGGRRFIICALKEEDGQAEIKWRESGRVAATQKEKRKEGTRKKVKLLPEELGGRHKEKDASRTWGKGEGNAGQTDSEGPAGSLWERKKTVWSQGEGRGRKRARKGDRLCVGEGHVTRRGGKNDGQG